MPSRLSLAFLLPLLLLGHARIAAASPSQDSGLTLLRSYDLLKAAHPSAILDSAYCNRPDLVYDLAMTVTAGWDSDKDTDQHALFTLGRNMTGKAQPNSISVMVWAGNTVFARLTSSDMSDHAQVISTKQTIKPGQTYTVHVRWTTDTVSLDWDGVHIGDGKMASGMVWPVGCPYFVGCEDVGTSPWSGQIDSAELQVLQARISAEIDGGRAAGYFVGPTSHKLKIAFRSADGGTVMTQLSLTDIEGRTVVDQLTPTSQSDRLATFELPKLRYGWYTAEVELKSADSHLELTRSLVITPALTALDPADVSPFGIATEDISDRPALAESEMARISAMGIRWLRVWVPWTDIERTRGVYDFSKLDAIVARAASHGLTIYPCLMGGSEPWQTYASVEKAPWYLMSRYCYMPRSLVDWSSYVTQFARHYHGKIQDYQVWNEPDARNGFFPFDPADYAQVVKVASDAIHSVDSRNEVALGGLCAAYGDGLINSSTIPAKTAHGDWPSFTRKNPSLATTSWIATSTRSTRRSRLGTAIRKSLRGCVWRCKKMAMARSLYGIAKRAF